jgi:lycopene cyclase domain-containing protein
MTYWGFHARFNLPLVFLLGWWANVPHWRFLEWMMLGIVLVLVMLFTAPWDNAAARAGMWRFPKGRYWRKIGWLPVEEYLFFWLQSLVVVFAVVIWTGGGMGIFGEKALFLTPGRVQCAGLLLLAWLATGIYLWHRPPARRWRYARHLFFWFAPLVLLQWILEPNVLAACSGLLAGVTIAIGTYYTWADTIAVRSGIWKLDETQITGARLPGGLPWEEAAFFYLTTLLVAQSAVLFLAPALC